MLLLKDFPNPNSINAQVRVGKFINIFPSLSEDYYIKVIVTCK